MMTNDRIFHRAFTMIELIMVIVVFGIIAMIGADIFVKIYDNYMIARTMNTLQTKTELVLDQIGKRLQYRIKDSTIARNDALTPPYKFLGDANTSYTILEWIGYDDISLKGYWDGSRYHPAWSGFIDLDISTKDNASTPGSNLSKLNEILKKISSNQLTLSGGDGKQRPVIIMDGRVGDYFISSFGWSPHSDHNYTMLVTRRNDTLFSFVESNTSKELYEHYKFAWTAYALVPEKPDGSACSQSDLNRSDCNLYLVYNYQPWHGEKYDNNGTRSLMTENINAFKFSQTGDTIRLKLCIGTTVYDTNISFCKEKVVF